MPPPFQSIPEFPSNLAIPGISLDGHVTWESRDTWTRGVYGCPSSDNPGMARLLGNPGILGQGGITVYGCPSWDNPGMARLLVNPGILGQGGKWLCILG